MATSSMVAQELRDPLVLVRVGAQVVFFMRFVVAVDRQREAAGTAPIPIAFWYLSLAGGLALFVYALHERDLVIMAGQLLACVHLHPEPDADLRPGQASASGRPARGRLRSEDAARATGERHAEPDAGMCPGHRFLYVTDGGDRC